MNRRALLAGASLAAVSRAFAQPMPIPGPAGAPPFNAGPLWSPEPPGKTLDLSFITPGTMPSGVTFTRASTGTYFNAAGTMQTATANTPRWDYDPATLALRGLLIEEARTNLVLNSGNPAVWSATGNLVAAPTLTANQATAPDGTLTATRAVYPPVSGASAWSLINPLGPYAVSSAASYTLSLFMKGSVGGERVYLCATPDGTTYFRVTATLTTSWQRYVLSASLGVSSWYFEVGTDLRDASQTSTPAQTIFVWGGQVELGACATSYVPTAAATATRAADAASMPTAAWYNGSASTISVEAAWPSGSDNQTAVCIDDGATTNIARVLRLAPTNNIDTQLIANGTGVYTNTIGGMVPLAAGKSALAYRSGYQMSGYNGTAIAADVQTTIPVNATTLRIGSLAGAQQMLNGYARRVRYWPRALSSAELQSVTT